MHTLNKDTQRYAKAIEISKRVHWEIDRDLLRGRSFEFDRKFMPDGLSLVNELGFLTSAEQRLLSRIQGRTYANMFGLIERFISAKITELSREHCLGDQTAFEALIRFTDEELKHQALFRRIEAMLAADMPDGYVCVPDADEVAATVLGNSSWAVLAQTNHIELLTLAHYRSSIATDPGVSPLWKDVFLFHWKDESQHVVIDELEWRREDARLNDEERDAAVDQFIGLVGAVDRLACAQAGADAAYFTGIVGLTAGSERALQVERKLIKAYRWQYMVSGVMEPRFQKLLRELVSEKQAARIQQALAPLMYAVPERPAMPLPMAA